MRRIILTIAVSLSTIATIRAGDDSEKNRLGASLSVRFDAIAKAQKANGERYAKEMNEAKRPEAIDAAVDRYVKGVNEHADAALKLAEECPDDPSGAKALAFVIKIANAGPSDHSQRALRLLLRHHVRTEGAHQALGVSFFIIHVPEVEALGRAILKDNPHRKDQGHACAALADILEYKSLRIRRLRDDPKLAKSYRDSYGPEIDRLVQESDPAKMEAEAQTLRERAIAEFGDVPLDLFDWPDKRTIGQLEAGRLFAHRNLNVGQPAPEIEGKDERGESFKLSESRGKVVVLTFSGDWCGPCVAMYPDERELVKRSKREPIAVLSVNTDAKVETLRKAIADGSVTWRCWWDGGVDGPIVTQWGVTAFPQVFVIDREGVIRFKNVRDQELKNAVDQLLKADAAKNR